MFTAYESFTNYFYKATNGYLAYSNAIEFYAFANPPFDVHKVVYTTVNKVQVSFMCQSN
jgi:hypothetical protein